jgi:hypothetical protein
MIFNNILDGMNGWIHRLKKLIGLEKKKRNYYIYLKSFLVCGEPLHQLLVEHQPNV